VTFVDLHLHLLPGLDDGPRRLEGSVLHARRLVDAGVDEVCVTPHVAHPDFGVRIDEIADRTAGLQDVLDRLGIPLRLHAGGEIRAAGAVDLSARELAAIAHGPPDARWVLLEPSFDGIDAMFLAACEHVRSCGFGIVVAHPERARGFLRTGLARLCAEIERGAVLQVSTCSLLGLHGPAVLATATTLVRDGLAGVVASDGHGDTRSHTVADGYRLAGHPLGLVQDAPRRLLRDGLPPVAACSQRGNDSRHARA